MIPKTQESDEKRKMRLLMEEVDRLRDVVDSLARRQTEDAETPNPHEEIPNSVQAAFRVMCEYRERITPIRKISSPFGLHDTEEHYDIKEPAGFELDIVRAASSVLVDYFDRHNVSRRLKASRPLDAPKTKRGKT